MITVVKVVYTALIWVFPLYYTSCNFSIIISGLTRLGTYGNVNNYEKVVQLLKEKTFVNYLR